MLNNVLIIDRNRIGPEPLLALPTTLIRYLDLYAVRNPNGTYEVVKNRLTGHNGLVADEFFEESILSEYIR